MYPANIQSFHRVVLLLVGWAVAPALFAQSGGGSGSTASWAPGGMSASSVVEQTIYRGGIAGGDDSELVSEAVLPAELMAFRALPENGRVTINWQTVYEADVSHYEVEYCAQGTHFTVVAERLPLPGQSTAERDYRISLPRPTGAEAFYRLRTVDADGSFAYSDIEQLTFGPADWSFVPRANPIVNQTLEIELSGSNTAEPLMLTVHSLDGRQQLRQSLGPDTRESYQLSLNLPPAIYVVSVADNHGGRQSHRVVVGR